MMYRIYGLLLALSFTSYTYTLDWIKTSDSKQNSSGKYVECDTILNRVYFLGSFDTLVNNRDTISTIFLSALDSLGNLLWQKNVWYPSEALDDFYVISLPRQIVVGKDNSLYLIGKCYNTIIIDTITLPKNSEKKYSSGAGDLFIVKMDKEGHAFWARRFESQYTSDLQDIIVLEDGIYLGGSSKGDLTIGSMSYIGSLVFTCKFDLDGNLIWFKKFDTLGSIRMFPRSKNFFGIVSNYSKNSFSKNSLSYNNKTLINSGKFGMVYFTCTKDGDISIDSTFYDVSASFFYNKVYGGQGNYYLTGTFDSTTIFGTEKIYVQDKRQDHLIAKVDTSGTFKWARTQSFSSNVIKNVHVGTKHLLFTDTKHLLYCGSFSGVLGFNDQILDATQFSDSLNFDGFLFEFDENGTCTRKQQLSGPGLDAICGLAKDNKSNIYITGWYDRTAVFFNKSFPAHSGINYFLCKVSDNNLYTKKYDSGIRKHQRLTLHTFMSGYGNTSFLSTGDVFNIRGQKINFLNNEVKRKHNLLIVVND